MATRWIPLRHIPDERFRSEVERSTAALFRHMPKVSLETPRFGYVARHRVQRGPRFVLKPQHFGTGERPRRCLDWTTERVGDRISRSHGEQRSPPVSRVLLRRARSRAMTVIPLGPSLPPGSSRLPADSASSVVVRLFGVAPDGGCRVSPATREGSDSSLWPCSSPLPTPRGIDWCGRALPGIPLCGARTFLSLER